jgi:hypothetical protein
MNVSSMPPAQLKPESSAAVGPVRTSWCLAPIGFGGLRVAAGATWTKQNKIAVAATSVFKPAVLVMQYHPAARTVSLTDLATKSFG